MGGNATDVWEERGWREGERVEVEGWGGDATAAYQWVPFKFPGIIGGKRGGGKKK